MSTADGLLLAIANALSHDLYYKIIDPKADTKTRLIVARVLLLVVGAVGTFVASMKLTSILGAVAWAFCLLTLVTVLPTGPWCLVETGKPCWRDCWYDWRLLAVNLPLSSPVQRMTPWLGIDGLRFGMIGMPVRQDLDDRRELDDRRTGC